MHLLTRVHLAQISDARLPCAAISDSDRRAAHFNVELDLSPRGALRSRREFCQARVGCDPAPTNDLGSPQFTPDYVKSARSSGEQ
eukprot:4310685-Pleurochrysis_carterae.AAC.2